jgi:hypothetical protein
MRNYLADHVGTGTRTLTRGQFEQVADSHIINPDGADFSAAPRDSVSAVAGLFDRDAEGAVPREGRLHELAEGRQRRHFEGAGNVSSDRCGR